MPTRNALARRAGALALTTAVIAAASLSIATGAGADHDARKIELGAAEEFLVLADTEVTNSGSTTITGGSVGVSPGTLISGFPPGVIVGGTAQVNTGPANDATAALNDAYIEAFGRDPDSTFANAQLGGLTLTSGVYRGPTGRLLLDGPLTLDGGGDLDSVFIFQATSGFDIGSTAQVLLTGDAQACNVFFQVGSDTTIAAGADFAGTILARSAITVEDDASIDGRLFALDANVTLINDDVFISACIPAETTTSIDETTTSTTIGSTTSTTIGSTTSTTAGSTTSTTAGSTTSTTATTVPTTAPATTSTSAPTTSTSAPTTSSTTTPTTSTTPTTAPTTSTSAPRSTVPAATATSTTQAPGVPGVVGPPRTGGAPPAPAGSPWSSVIATGLLSGAGALGVVLHRRERLTRVELPVE